MDLLPLELVGWLYTVACGMAIVAGAWIVIAVHLRGDRSTLAVRVLDDSLLFGLWLLGLAGGVGVLLGRGWSRPVLELFCWTMMVMLMLTVWSRWRAAPPPRTGLVISMALFVIPVLAVAGATIMTLRSETALRLLSG